MKLVLITGSVLGMAMLLVGCQRNQPAPVIEEELTSVVDSIVEEDSSLPNYQAVIPADDPENATYIIEGQPVTLVDGQAEVPTVPESASVSTVNMFGMPVKGDLTYDQIPDAAVVLVVQGSGSGVFYYQAAALNENGQYVGTNAVLLGDRIAPQTTQIVDNTIVANYAERAPGEPMTTQPSVGVSKYMQVQNGILVEVDSP